MMDDEIKNIEPDEYEDVDNAPVVDNYNKQYIDFMDKVRQVCLAYDAQNDKLYIWPDWRNIMHNRGLNPYTIYYGGQILTFEIVFNSLELQCKLHNEMHDKTTKVMSWILQAMTTVVDPKMQQVQIKALQSVLDSKKESDIKKNTGAVNFNKKNIQ